MIRGGILRGLPVERVRAGSSAGLIAVAAAKLAAVGLILALDPNFQFVRWVTLYLNQGRYGIALGIVLIGATCILAILACGFLANRWLRTLLVAFLALFYWANLTYYGIVGENIDYTAANVLLSEVGAIGDVVGLYHREGLAVLAMVLPLAAVLAYLPRRFPLKLPAWVGSFPLLGVVAVFPVLYTTGGVSKFPSAFTLPGQLGLVALLRPYNGPRQEVAYAGAITPMVRRVVFIVDESVRGDLLGINDPCYPTTPYLAAGRAPWANFGIASAISNCSTSTRLALRAGLCRDQIPDRDYAGLRQPSLWQLAKRAGFETVYIEAFRPSGGFHSYMNGHEVAAVDRSYHLADLPKPQIDMQVAELLRQVLARPGPVFVYVEKAGVHFPYYENYPPRPGPQPALPVTALHRYGSRDEMVADYAGAIRWRVDAFFEKLLDGIGLSDSLIVYTSDHGQNLLDDGVPATHCRTRKPIAAEARVPLLALTGHPDLGRDLARAAERSRDRLSQFPIVPTLLTAMGYDPAWVRREKGESLLQAGGEADRSFYVGTIFGQPRPGRWVPFSPRG